MLKMACESLQVRKAQYGLNATLSYEEPINLERGEGTYLFDKFGKKYLDCVNNVAHVGHCHPKVTEAICKQLAILNTNARYLNDMMTIYIKALLSTLPSSLEVMYMVNSGSEANDLALRVALAGRAPNECHVVVLSGAYHGTTLATMELSPYKFWGERGEGQPPHVHVIPCPDLYRGLHLDGAAAARAVVAEVHQAGGRIAVCFVESILSCGGQVVPPPGYLKALYEVMHSEGALVVADEVQCGFGRLGPAFWGFQLQGAEPDIVTMGKSIGNGFPMATVVMTRPVAEHFAANAPAYFNTYGGCNAACAAGLAVLQVVEEENLPEHAERVGAYLKFRLMSLQHQFPFLGDVRGLGLMLGVEVVWSASGKEPAGDLARWIKERMREAGVLLSTDGPHDNVIKIKPPLVFGEKEADHLVDTLRSVLASHATRIKMMQEAWVLDQGAESTGHHLQQLRQSEKNSTNSVLMSKL